MKPITFKHRYHKLAKTEFTTIRGAAQFKRLKVGQKVDVETPDENFTATITSLELRTVRSMTVEFLHADASYPGFVVDSHETFVRLLNSFRAPMWTHVTMESELTVITLSRKQSDKLCQICGFKNAEMTCSECGEVVCSDCIREGETDNVCSECYGNG
jgi:hypothetical protein